MPVKNILVRKIAQCREKGECSVVGWTKSQLRQAWLNSGYYAVKNGHGKCTAFTKGSMKLQGKLNSTEWLRQQQESFIIISHMLRM